MRPFLNRIARAVRDYNIFDIPQNNIHKPEGSLPKQSALRLVFPHNKRRRCNRASAAMLFQTVVRLFPTGILFDVVVEGNLSGGDGIEIIFSFVFTCAESTIFVSVTSEFY